MDALLSILATLALAFSTFLVVALAGSTKGFTLRAPSGPDAMGLIGRFLIQIVAWIATLAAGWFVVATGGMVWLAPPALGGALVVLLVAAGNWLLGMLALAGSLERRIRLRWLIGWVGVVGVHAASNAYVLALAWGDPVEMVGAPWPRIAGVPVAFTAVVGAGIGLVIWVGSEMKSASRARQRFLDDAAREQEQQQEQAARDAAHAAELAALPDDAPLATFAAHLFLDKSDAHHALAIARIMALPDLAARFGEELDDPDPLAREYLLNIIRVAPPRGVPLADRALGDALTPTFERMFDRLGADLAWLKDQPDHRAHKHARGMTLGLLLSASRLPTRLVEPARRLRSAWDIWPVDSTRDAAQALLDAYIEGRPLPE